MTALQARRQLAHRVGRHIGRLAGTAVSVTSGYVLAKHGVVIALAIQGGFVVAGLAVLGALNTDWSDAP